MTRLRLLLLAQLAFFAAWGGYLLTSHVESIDVWLETEPIDPRDLLAGHYVALRYPMETNADRLCDGRDEAREATEVFIRLEESGVTATLSKGGFAPLYEATACTADDEAPERPGIWVRATRGTYTQIGIERFYLPEDSPLRNARSGQVVARVAVNERGEARLLALERQLIPTPSR